MRYDIKWNCEVGFGCECFQCTFGKCIGRIVFYVNDEDSYEKKLLHEKK